MRSGRRRRCRHGLGRWPPMSRRAPPRAEAWDWQSQSHCLPAEPPNLRSQWIGGAATNSKKGKTQMLQTSQPIIETHLLAPLGERVSCQHNRSWTDGDPWYGRNLLSSIHP